MRWHGQLRARGFIPFPEEVVLDLDALGDAKLVAVSGANGIGKSTLLGMLMALLDRSVPTRGTLNALATDRDAFIEGSVGGFKIRHVVDGVKGGGTSSVLDPDGRPVLKKGHVSEFDEWRDDAFPPSRVLLNSVFLPQGSSGLLREEKAARTAVILRAIGVEHLEGLAKRAGERHREALDGFRVLETRVTDALRTSGPHVRVEDYEEDARARRLELLRANEDLASSRSHLETMEAEVVRVQALREAAAVVSVRRSDLRRAMDAAHDQAQKLAERRDRLVSMTMDLPSTRELAAGYIEACRVLDDAVAALQGHDQALAEMRTTVKTARQRELDLKHDLQRLGPEPAMSEGSLNAPRIAIEALPDAREKAVAAATAYDDVCRRLKEARSWASTGAGARIAFLRAGLQTIADDAFVSMDCNVPDYARGVLAMDDLRSDAKRQQEIDALEAEAVAALGAQRDAEKLLANLEHTASRLAEVEGHEERVKRWRETDADLRARIEAAGKDAADTTIAGQARAQVRDVADVAMKDAHIKHEAALRAHAALPGLDGYARDLVAAREHLSSAEHAASDARAAWEAAPPMPETPDVPDVKPARDLVRQRETIVASRTTAAALADKNLADARERETRVAKLRAEREATQVEMADWQMLGADLKSVQGLEVDAAGPELSTLANDVLHSGYGGRFSMRIDTTKETGKGAQREVFEISVLDREQANERESGTLSGGEGVIVADPIAFALAVRACRAAGIDRPTLVRDESGASLDPDATMAWIGMLRRAIELAGAQRVIYTSHNPEAVAMADAVIHVEGKPCRVWIERR